VGTCLEVATVRRGAAAIDAAHDAHGEDEAGAADAVSPSMMLPSVDAASVPRGGAGDDGSVPTMRRRRRVGDHDANGGLR